MVPPLWKKTSYSQICSFSWALMSSIGQDILLCSRSRVGMKKPCIEGRRNGKSGLKGFYVSESVLWLLHVCYFTFRDLIETRPSQKRMKGFQRPYRSTKCWWWGEIWVVWCYWHSMMFLCISTLHMHMWHKSSWNNTNWLLVDNYGLFLCWLHCICKSNLDFLWCLSVCLSD